MQQFDIIPYYNILDNTAWITIDVGLDIKVIQADIDVKALDDSTGNMFANSIATAANSVFTGYSDSVTAPIPLLYLRGRIEIPTTEFAIESYRW